MIDTLLHIPDRCNDILPSFSAIVRKIEREGINVRKVREKYLAFRSQFVFAKKTIQKERSMTMPPLQAEHPRIPVDRLAKAGSS